MSIPPSVVAILGGALAILLAFRNASAYERWWEARKIWGMIVNESRTFTRQALTVADPDNVPDELLQSSYKLVRGQIASIYAMRLQTKEITDREVWDREVGVYFSPKEYEGFMKANNRVTQIGMHQGWAIKELNARRVLDMYRPGGINDAHKLDVMLSRALINAHYLESFDSLPRPFRCVTVDWVSAEEIVFDQGNRPAAMRASASIPVYFDHVVTEDHYLIDGGVLNNFPADHLKAMGADIIIGVDVETTLAKSPEDASFTDILLRTSFFYGAKINKERRKYCDVLIIPDVHEFSAGVFTDAEAIMPRGEIASGPFMEELKAIVLKQGLQDTIFDFNQHFPDSLIVERITIEGRKDLSSEIITGNLAIPFNTVFPEQKIADGMERLWATGLLKNTAFECIQQRRTPMI